MKTEVVGMAKRKDVQIKCTVEFTEGAMQRITEAFVDLYYGIKDGIYEGPSFPEKSKETETEDRTA